MGYVLFISCEKGEHSKCVVADAPECCICTCECHKEK